MEKLGKGWFSEVNDQWPGQATSLKVDKVLWDKQSKFQHVQCFSSPSNGKVLILDDVIQLTEKDEIAYHEMFSHIAAFAHPNPKTALVVGGGDGGILRELGKHKGLKSITICDIDSMVGEVTKKLIPSVGCGYDDPRVKVVVEDANKFLDEKENHGKYDLILSDTSDPVGPAQFLFEAPFYRKMHKALAPGGVCLTQAENIWLTMPLITRLVKATGGMFANVQYAVTQVPTYPSGIIGFLVLKKAGGAGALDLSKPDRQPPSDMALRYYTPRLHHAAFQLPAFAEKEVEAARLEALGFNKFEKRKAQKKQEQSEPPLKKAKKAQ